MKDKLRTIKEKAEESTFVPTVGSTLRAGVAAIPWIGGTLDHLLFDKADEIRIKNIEKALRDISDKMGQISENSINKNWFDSEEAIELFKQLVDKVQFEQDTAKSSTLSKIYAISGTNEFSTDPNKFAVLQKVAELTTVQKKLLQIIEKVQPVKRQFTGGSLQSSAISIWFDDIMNAVKTNPEGKFWEGTLQLDVELEIIESFNLITRTNAPLVNMRGYEISRLGKLVLKYINNAS
ncbi:MAG TPA: hypothetical protein PLG33_04305 [Prolixibacteraceae bacterium]|nr:hypothetical protein [Prolixibacteraceae bacterium]HPR85249.1 hypothetical protein [Prolixibacteraceae bacterium]